MILSANREFYISSPQMKKSETLSVFVCLDFVPAFHAKTVN